MSEQFAGTIFCTLLFISFIFYLSLKYFDYYEKKNTKYFKTDCSCNHLFFTQFQEKECVACTSPEKYLNSLKSNYCRSQCCLNCKDRETCKNRAFCTKATSILLKLCFFSKSAFSKKEEISEQQFEQLENDMYKKIRETIKNRADKS